MLRLILRNAALELNGGHLWSHCGGHSLPWLWTLLSKLRASLSLGLKGVSYAACSGRWGGLCSGGSEPRVRCSRGWGFGTHNQGQSGQVCRPHCAAASDGHAQQAPPQRLPPPPSLRLAVLTEAAALPPLGASTVGPPAS